MKTLQRCTLLATLLIGLTCTFVAHAQTYPLNRGYIYDAPRGWVMPPPVSPYYLAPYGYGAYYRPLAPYGFGSPYYNGYNDPYYYGYGPGTRQFLRFGGADFYGW